MDSISTDVYVAGGFSLYIPNAFSPSNGDLLNNSFKPICLHLDKKRFYIDIFDRWGVKLPTITDPDLGWDGRVKQQITFGVYNWMIKCYDERGILHWYSGSVTILP